MVTSYVDWVVANPDWARFIFRARAEVIRGEAAVQLREESRERVRALKDWIEPHIEAGRIRNLALELFHPLVNGPAQDYVRHWLAGRVTASPATYRDILADAAWRSVAAVQ